jgi:hypothetical protein
MRGDPGRNVLQDLQCGVVACLSCRRLRPGYRWDMSTDSPLPDADPSDVAPQHHDDGPGQLPLEADEADVAAQHQEAAPPVDDHAVDDLDPDQVPLEADEADVADQQTAVPAWVDDLDET